MNTKRILALSLFAAMQGCSALSGLGGGAEPQAAPSAPLRIAQVGHGPSAQFMACDTDCPQRTPKTLWVPPPRIAFVPTPAPAPEPAKYVADVRFAFGKSILGPEGRRVMATLLKQARNATRIVITGYTDSIGSQSANDHLARKRAETIKTFLVKGGIKAEIIEIAKGKCCYVGDNKTDSGRAVNRRATVEIHQPTKEGKK
jgi:hypothetical protein